MGFSLNVYTVDYSHCKDLTRPLINTQFDWDYSEKAIKVFSESSR